MGEASFLHSSGFGLDESGRATVIAAPAEHREQLLDFLLHTGYRNSMLTHADYELTPPVHHEWIGQQHLVTSDPLIGFTFDPLSAEPLTLPIQSGAVTLSDTLVKAALQHLINQYPQTITLSELVALSQATIASPNSPEHDHEQLAQSMLAFYGAGLIKAFKSPPHVNGEVTMAPQAHPLAREAARRDLEIVNQWHENVRDLSADARYVLTLLDGTRDLAAIVSELQQHQATQATSEGSTARTPNVTPAVFVSDCLGVFALRCLLV
jgi:methyltransferase-like protein